MGGATAYPLDGLDDIPSPAPNPKPKPQPKPAPIYLPDGLSDIPAPPLERRGANFGQSFKEGVSDIGRMGLGLPALGEQLSSWIMGGAPDGSTPFSDTLRDMALTEENQRQVQQDGFAAPSLPVTIGEGATRSGVAMVPALALAPVAAGAGLSPLAINAVAATPGAISTGAGQLGQDLNDPEMGTGQRIGRSFFQGGLEFGGEILPIGRLGRGPEEALAKTLIGQGERRTLRELATEPTAQGIQEAITGGAQSIANDTTGTAPVTLGEVASNAGENALVSGLTGMPMAAGTSALTTGAGAVRNRMDERAIDKEMSQAVPQDLASLALHGLDPAQATNGQLPQETPQDAPLSITPDVIETAKRLPELLKLFGIRSAVDETATEQERQQIAKDQQAKESAQLERTRELRAVADDAAKAHADRTAEEQALRQMEEEDALKQMELEDQAKAADAAAPKEVNGRAPDAPVVNEEHQRFQSGMEAAAAIEADYQAEIQAINARRSAPKGEKIGKDQATALRIEALGRRNQRMTDAVQRATAEGRADVAGAGRAGETRPAMGAEVLETGGKPTTSGSMEDQTIERTTGAPVLPQNATVPTKVTPAIDNTQSNKSPLEGQVTNQSQQSSSQSRSPGIAQPTATAASAPQIRATSVPVRSIADLDRGFREVYGLKPDESAAAVALVRARAAALGEDADEFAARTISEVRQGAGKAGDDALLQEQGTRIDAPGQSLESDTLHDTPKGEKSSKGAISFADDGKSVIHALNAPDVSTAVHELGHLFRRTLSPAELAIAGRWAGAKDGKWGRGAEEKFARAFERYLRDGTAPNSALQKVFGKLRDWLRNVYQSIKGSPIDVTITPEIRSLFDRMLAPKDAAHATALSDGITADEQRATKSRSTENATEAAANPDPSAVHSEPIKGTDQGTTAQLEGKSLSKETSSTSSISGIGRTTAEQKAEAKTSHPELANPASETPVRKLVREAREKMADPERKAQEQSTAEGKALLGDPGKTAALRKKVAAGEALTDVETAAFAELLDREGASAIAEGGAKLKQTIEAIQGYTRGGTEQARALAMRRDRSQTPEDRRKSALMHAVLMPSQRVEEALKKQHDKIAKASPSEKASLQKQLDQMTTREVLRIEKFKKRMAGLGFNLDELDLLYQSDAKTAAVVDEARIDKADNWDAAYEWWMSSILSGPKTNITNAVGNAGNFLSNYLWEKPITAILAKIPGLRNGGPSAGELGAVYKALFSGDAWGFAARHFTDSWSAERPMLDAEMASGRFLTQAQARMANDSGGQYNAHAPVNRNIVAKALRGVSLRAIMAVDQFFKGLAARAEVAGRAYRLANESGYQPGSPEHAEFMSQEIGDLESRSWEHAYEEAKRLTFNQRPGPIIQGVVHLRGKVPGARYIVPFIPILANLIGRGLRLSPVTSQINQAQRIVRQGLWAASPGMRGALPYTKAEFIQDLAAGTVGLLALGILGSWADDDKDGFPNLTGTESRYIPAKDQTVPPKSIRLFGKYWDYSRISPFDSVLATVADFHNARKKKDDAIGTVINNIQYQVLDKSFMSTINDVTKAIATGEGGSNTVARIMRGVVVGFVPNIIRQPLGASQEDTKDQKVYAHASPANPSWWLEQGRLTLGSVAGGLPFVPKVDLWGKEQSQGKEAPTEKLGSDFLWRALAPMAGSDGKASNDFEQAIYNWNKTAEKPKWPGYPRNYITKPDGERWYYSSESYNAMLKDRGDRVMKALTKVKEAGWEMNPLKPTDRDMKVISRVFDMANIMAQKPYRDKIKAKPAGLDD